MNLWAALWWHRDSLDGDDEHIMYESCLPKLFRTRRECRVWIKENYGYIKNRPDLRKYPHGWRLPKAIKVTITQGGGKSMTELNPKEDIKTFKIQFTDAQWDNFLKRLEWSKQYIQCMREAFAKACAEAKDAKELSAGQDPK